MEINMCNKNNMFFTVVYLLLIYCASAQLPPAFGNLPQPAATSSPNCNYLLSAGTPGSCVITTVDVERKLDLLRDGLSRHRLQFVAHNSVVQSQLTDLQNRDKQLSLQIDGMRRDLRALGARGIGTSSSVPSGGGSNANLNRLQATLTQAINTVDNKLTNLSRVYQRDAFSQSTINSALQRQLTQVVQENQQLKATTATLSLQMQQLATQMRGLAAAFAAGQVSQPPAATTRPTAAPTTSATQPAAVGPTINPAVINSILQSIQTLTTASNKNTVDITQLKNQQSAITNNTNGIINLSAELKAAKVLLANTTQKADGVYNWLQTFNQQTLPAINTDINNIKAFSSNLSNTQRSIQATVSGLQNDFVVGQARQDQAVNDLAQGITSSLGTSVQIRSQLQSLQQKIKNTLKPQAIITPPLISGKTTPPLFVPPTLRPRPGK